MSFAIFRRSDVRQLVETISESARVTVVVGAGASIEADLPDWETLVRRLLSRAAESFFEADESGEREGWIETTIAKDSLLGAAAVVEALSSEQLQTWLVEELFGAEGASAYAPGPIADSIARLQRQLGRKVTIITSNYDDLVEQSLLEAGYTKRSVKSYIQRREVHVGAAAVTHLHGYAGRDEIKGTLVLSEEHYHRMQRGSSWQERLMAECLRSSNCLFIGSSLNDPNLIRYLYGYGGARRHFVIFVRQADPPDMNARVREGREAATAARWLRCGVEAIFVDHFADVAHVVHEITRRSVDQARYVPLDERATAWITDVEASVIGIGSDHDFRLGQQYLTKRLRELLERAIREAAVFGADFSNEAIAASLWLATPDGQGLTSWATTNRLHIDRGTITPVPIEADSRWVAIEAFCRGTRVEDDREVYASRWKYIRGLPLTPDVAGFGRLPIGCLTISSTLPGSETMLVLMDDGVKAAFHTILVEGMLAFLSEARTQ